MKAIIWHNPRCSKSRQTLALLEEREDLKIEIVRYLDESPSRESLVNAAETLGIEPRKMMRKGEAAYKEQSLKSADDETLFDAMAEHPTLIERPIVFANGKAVIGRPPENISELFDD